VDFKNKDLSPAAGLDRLLDLEVLEAASVLETEVRSALSRAIWV